MSARAETQKGIWQTEIKLPEIFKKHPWLIVAVIGAIALYSANADYQLMDSGKSVIYKRYPAVSSNRVVESAKYDVFRLKEKIGPLTAEEKAQFNKDTQLLVQNTLMSQEIDHYDYTHSSRANRDFVLGSAGGILAFAGLFGTLASFNLRKK